MIGFPMETTSPGAALREYTDRLEANGIKFGDGVFLAGGAIRRAICGHPIGEGDFDVYLTKDWDFAEAMLTYRWEKISPRVKKPELHMVSYDFNIDSLHTQLHYVKDSTIRKVLDTFDFTCCQFFFDGDKIHYPSTALEDARNLRLRLTGTFGQFTVARAFRFMGMGFKATRSVLEALQKQAAAEAAARTPGRYDIAKASAKGFS